MFYHFCTNGLLKNLLFVSDQDYIYAMNAIAFSKLKYPSVNILAFCIMNNHVHFIFDCEENEGRNFMIYYKRRIGMYLHDLYPNERNLVGADVACKEMSDPDYIVKAIAYVLRNPLSAGIKLVPNEYRWSSACLYFGSRVFVQCRQNPTGDNLMTYKKQMLKTHCALPEQWHIDNDGLIFPGDYTDYKRVEKIFGSPSQLMFYILKNYDAELEYDTGVLTKTKYSDAELCASRDSLISMMFHKNNLTQLSIEEKIRLAVSMKKKYAASWPCLSRIIGLDRSLLKSMW